jgi:enolase-phosphatase E1
VTDSLSIKDILLDIEGTTTPIAFVHDVLFSYARAHAGDYLARHPNEAAADVAQLREEHERDVNNGEQPPPLNDTTDSIVTYVNWLIDRDLKSTGLKSLQGKIWRVGYREGSLKAQVFGDVRAAFQRWRAAKLRISIFSSGSALAQELLFAHTEAGDLTSFISDYFDTNVGRKADPESYDSIAKALELQPKEIVFISDVVAELQAAKTAGMKTLLSIRPGNPPQRGADRFRIIHTFDDV